MARRIGTLKEPNDIVSLGERSRMMGAVGQKDTPPELTVRAILRSQGFHYRVRNRDLAGSPDIANRRKKWAVFVNGCFWHGHRNCPKTKSGSEPRIPVKNAVFWKDKIGQNRHRDARKIKDLRVQGVGGLGV